MTTRRHLNFETDFLFLFYSVICRLYSKQILFKKMSSQPRFGDLAQFVYLEPNARLCELDDGTLIFFKDGMVHRKHGPAVIYLDGTEEYWCYGRRHRKDGYAIISGDVCLKFRNGKFDPKYYNEDGELRYDTNGPNYINYITRTYHALKSASPRELGLQNLTFVDTKEKGTIKYYYRGIQHFEDGPVEYKKSGTKVYYMYGVKHRDNGPAIIDVLKGSEYWYQYGMLHREDGPASTVQNKIFQNRLMYTWYKHGVVHRLDGPAYITYHALLNMNIYTGWYKDGLYHRSAADGQGDGPCTEHIIVNDDDTTLTGSVYRMWFSNCVFHRIGGPSVEIDGKNMRWTINGIDYNEQDYNRVVERLMRCASIFKKPLRRRLSQHLYESNLPGLCKNISSLISDYVY